MKFTSIRGVVHRILPKREISDKWTVKEFVLKLDQDPRYPQFRLYQGVKEVVQEVEDNIRVGDTVECEVVFRGREFKSKKDENEMAYFPIDEVHKITLVMK